MSERLEEAEGGAEGQVTTNHNTNIMSIRIENIFVLFWRRFLLKLEINRKRDVELTKLRKLLEDVHLESEETAHILKRKHQEIVSDFNEQLEALTKSKQR